MNKDKKNKIIIASVVALLAVFVIVVVIMFFVPGNINTVKSKVKDQYIITKGEQNIIPKINGCQVALENSDVLKRITRDTEDKMLDLVFNAKCGSEEEKINAKAIIKKSPYTYEATANENMQNYDLIIKENDKVITDNGNLYDLQGSWLSEILNGKAIINNMDIKDYPDFKIVFEDKNTIFVINKK